MNPGANMIAAIAATLFVSTPSLESSETPDDPPDTLPALRGNGVLGRIKK